MFTCWNFCFPNFDFIMCIHVDADVFLGLVTNISFLIVLMFLSSWWSTFLSSSYLLSSQIGDAHFFPYIYSIITQMSFFLFSSIHFFPYFFLKLMMLIFSNYKCFIITIQNTYVDISWLKPQCWLKASCI